jgi:hypothetical protein
MKSTMLFSLILLALLDTLGAQLVFDPEPADLKDT